MHLTKHNNVKILLVTEDKLRPKTGGLVFNYETKNATVHEGFVLLSEKSLDISGIGSSDTV
jgi:hypothetical protein